MKTGNKYDTIQFLRTVLLFLWTWVPGAENPAKLPLQARQDLSELTWCFVSHLSPTPGLPLHPGSPLSCPSSRCCPNQGKKRQFFFKQREKLNGVSKIAPEDLNSDPWFSHPSSRSTKWGVRDQKRNSFHLWQYYVFWLAEALLSRVGEFADIYKPWQLWWEGQERGPLWWGRFTSFFAWNVSPCLCPHHPTLRVLPAC